MLVTCIQRTHRVSCRQCDEMGHTRAQVHTYQVADGLQRSLSRHHVVAQRQRLWVDEQQHKVRATISTRYSNNTQCVAPLDDCMDMHLWLHTWQLNASSCLHTSVYLAWNAVYDADAFRSLSR